LAVAERSTISQSVQIGVETTPGTGVAATRRLGSIGFEMGIQTEISGQRPIGQKYASLQILGKEWTEADVSGAPVYTELPYIFSSLIDTGVVTQIMDAATPTGAYRWVFESDTFGEDAPKTFTIEQGSAARAHRVTNAILSDWNMEWSREEISLGGTALARALEDGVTLTAGATGLDQIPVKPTDLSVYLDPTHTALGSTKMVRALSGEVSLESRYVPLWVVDRAQPSFVTTLEGEPELTFSLVLMADAQGMAPLTAMRAGETRFLRLEAVGPVIYPGNGTSTTQRHKMVIDIAGQISEPQEFEDADGVFAIGWEFTGVHSPAWTRAFRVEVITTLATL
jgi:hypothetical protein